MSRGLGDVYKRQVDSFELSPREADMLDAELAIEAQSEQPAEQAETDPEPSGA